jgi:aryl-alcohol dehydrogenase-like predicted oxidoreductase
VATHINAVSGSIALPRRPLGRTDMRITRVGFGSWAVGDNGPWAGLFKGDALLKGDALRRNLAVADAMQGVAARHGTGVAAVAWAAGLARPGARRGRPATTAMNPQRKAANTTIPKQIKVFWFFFSKKNR